MNLKGSLITIKVVGVGGCGRNAVNRMIEAGVGGVEFIAVDTDAMALSHATAPTKLAIGSDGRGAAGRPEAGQAAAEKSREEIKAHLKGAEMVIVVSGLGGGTGTGAAPIIASVARELGALTVSIVTVPFGFEGAHRMCLAQAGLEALRSESDTLIEIQQGRLKSLTIGGPPLTQAFMVADEMLRQGIQVIAELLNYDGLIGMYYEDVKSILANGRTAMMSFGVGTGEDRAVTAARQAVTSRLLNQSLFDAHGVLYNIKGGEDLELFEAFEIGEIIRKSSAPDANFVFNVQIDPALKDTVQITLIATGFAQDGPMTDDPEVDVSPFLRK